MNFELTEEQKAVRDAARDFAQNVLKPGVIERDTHQRFPKDEMKQLGELGFMGMMVDRSFRSLAHRRVALYSSRIGVNYDAYYLAIAKTYKSISRSPRCDFGRVRFGNFFGN